VNAGRISTTWRWLVRVPDEPHGIQVRPSHHMSKILHIIGWFDKHRKSAKENAGE
jgi:hypothetical protein